MCTHTIEYYLAIPKKEKRKKSCFLYFLFLYCFFFCFSGPHLCPKEVPRLEVKSKLQLPACQPQPQQCQIPAVAATYTTAHSNAGSKKRGQGWNSPYPNPHPISSWIPVGLVNCWATIGTPIFIYLYKYSWLNFWKCNCLIRESQYFFRFLVGLPKWSYWLEHWGSAVGCIWKFNLSDKNANTESVNSKIIHT